MARTRGISGTALGALAVGGLLIYAAITDQPVADALRNLIKGTAAKPSPFAKPSSQAGSADGVTIGAGPLASLATAASKYLGRPYKWGGNFDPPDGGGDCSGLVWRSFKDIGISAPRVSSAQLAWSEVRKISRVDISAGDLVGHFGVPGHIGIAISNSEAIFSPHTGTVVQVQNIDSVIVRSLGIYVRYVGSTVGKGRVQ
jgi:cell wall-associated NlpC family hydrolase